MCSTILLVIAIKDNEHLITQEKVATKNINILRRVKIEQF